MLTHATPHQLISGDSSQELPAPHLTPFLLGASGNHATCSFYPVASQDEGVMLWTGSFLLGDSQLATTPRSDLELTPVPIFGECSGSSHSQKQGKVLPHHETESSNLLDMHGADSLSWRCTATHTPGPAELLCVRCADHREDRQGLKGGHEPTITRETGRGRTSLRGGHT